MSAFFAPGRLFLFALVLVFVVRKNVGDEHKQKQDSTGRDGNVHSGRVLDIIRNIAEIRDGEDRRADYIFIMYERTVFGLVGIALCAETDHGGVFLVRDDAHDAVRGHRVLVQHERDGLSFFYGVGVYLLYIDQRTGVIGRLHRAGQHGEYLQSNDSRANQQERQKHHQRDQDAADHIPDFLERVIHKASFLSSSSKTSALTFGTTKL